MMRLMLFLLILSGIGAACASSEVPPPNDVSDESDIVIEGTGTIRYVDLEGGFYGIVDEDGAQYDPINLDDAYKEDGLRVHFLAETRDDVMSVRMWGTVVEIIAIERSVADR